MEDIIPLINELQGLFAMVKKSDRIKLPQIVVVGDQSSGKSSVLELIVGKDFLPRGSGIVTRCPLVLQLINIKQPELKIATNSASKSLVQKIFPEKIFDKIPVLSSSFTAQEATLNEKTEWAEFLHLKDQKLDLDEVQSEIESETNRRTGGKKNICEDPIILKIYSTKFPDLTLVDLPGITRNPVGDQPKDIETQVRNLIIGYISNKNSIILPVIAANQGKLKDEP